MVLVTHLAALCRVEEETKENIASLPSTSGKKDILEDMKKHYNRLMEIMASDAAAPIYFNELLDRFLEMRPPYPKLSNRKNDDPCVKKAEKRIDEIFNKLMP